MEGLLSAMGNGLTHWFADYKTEHGPIVETIEGKIRGKTFTFHDGRQVNAFMGVPFARNGTYSDRFKVAANAVAWFLLILTPF